jgi:hypothetical protein
MSIFKQGCTGFTGFESGYEERVLIASSWTNRWQNVKNVARFARSGPPGLSLGISTQLGGGGIQGVPVL